ncbi:hypothetical protein EDB84DRAFT_1559341 [Lactarius hengduanensis]|nr:hypothetical protein EDB84DRAFT_1559341 [Lactarius hengduanensis]
MAARSSRQLPLAWHITRDCDGLWKDIRRTGPKSVRRSVTISLWESSLSTLPGLVITAPLWLRAASVSSRETHRLIGPTSTILPSPDTADRHPVYATISAASAGVSEVTPALSALSSAHASIFGV